MRAKMAEAGLTPPTFKSDRGNDLFTAFFLFHHFLNEHDVLWLANFKQFSLNEEQLRALIFVRELGAIDNKSFRDLTRLDTLTASRNLRGMRDHGLLTNRGSGSQVYYSPGEALAPFLTLGPTSQGKGSSSQDKPGNIDRQQVEFEDLPVKLRKSLRHMQLKQRQKKKTSLQ